jgi:type IV pilus assembly protein PilX
MRGAIGSPHRDAPLAGSLVAAPTELPAALPHVDQPVVLRAGVARTVGPAPRPRGVALVCALMLTLVAAVLALAAGRMATTSLAAAQWERDHTVARAAADAALRDAERDIVRSFGRAGPPGGEPGGARAGAGAGIGPATPPEWSGPVPYGQRTGAHMAVGTGLLPAQLPAYRIESLPAVAPGEGPLMRITAIGYGLRPTTQVVVQVLYRTRPAGRIGWRELAHWLEESAS